MKLKTSFSKLHNKQTNATEIGECFIRKRLSNDLQNMLMRINNCLFVDEVEGRLVTYRQTLLQIGEIMKNNTIKINDTLEYNLHQSHNEIENALESLRSSLKGD